VETRAAGRKRGVDETNVRRCSGGKENLEGISKRKCAFRDLKYKYPYVKAGRYQYVMNTRENVVRVSVGILQY
jgi:hypothetical protein